MNSNYVAEIQSTSIPDEQLVSGDMCPGVNTALHSAAAECHSSLTSACTEESSYEDSDKN